MTHLDRAKRDKSRRLEILQDFAEHAKPDRMLDGIRESRNSRDYADVRRQVPIDSVGR